MSAPGLRMHPIRLVLELVLLFVAVLTLMLAFWIGG